MVTDGITFVMPDEELCDVISTSFDPKSAAKAIIDQAIQYGSEDNVSCIVVPFGSWGKYAKLGSKVSSSFGRSVLSTRFYSWGPLQVQAWNFRIKSFSCLMQQPVSVKTNHDSHWFPFQMYHYWCRLTLSTALFEKNRPLKFWSLQSILTTFNDVRDYVNCTIFQMSHC